jgi:hypothetical protein
MLFSCFGKKNIASDARTTHKDSLQGIHEPHFRMEISGEENSYIIEDISKEEYHLKLKQTDSLKNGSLQYWQDFTFDSSHYTKTDSCIFIPLDSLKELKFCDSKNGNEYLYYNYLGYMRELHAVFLYSENQDKQEIILVDKNNGDQYSFGHFPAFSPARKRYMVCSYNMEAFNVYNGFEIGTVGNGAYPRDIKIDGEKNGYWGADTPTWISENEIVFLRKSRKGEKETVRHCKITIR